MYYNSDTKSAVMVAVIFAALVGLAKYGLGDTAALSQSLVAETAAQNPSIIPQSSAPEMRKAIGAKFVKPSSGL